MELVNLTTEETEQIFVYVGGDEMVVQHIPFSVLSASWIGHSGLSCKF